MKSDHCIDLCRRRAVMYVAVIGAAAMITVIGITALTAVRIESRALRGGSDSIEAQLYARSAIEMGMHKMRKDADWRSNFVNGVWELNKPIGRGTYTLEGTDPIDGVLRNYFNEPLLLTGTGSVGASRYKLQVKVESVGAPLTCLYSAIHADSSLSFIKAIATAVGAPFSSNQTISAALSTVTGAVSAVSDITGLLYVGLQTKGITPRTMPASTVFDYYIHPANGTLIPIGSLPMISGTRTIQNAVLSKTSNPYGPVSPSGIYVIDAANQEITIKDSRISATLVILDPNPLSIEGSVPWNAPTPSYPALLVRGDATLGYSKQSLIENLVTYPSEITGLVYASGNITTTSDVSLAGVLVAGGGIEVKGSLTVTYSGVHATTPPPGFGSPDDKMEIATGTWKRVVD